MLRASEYVEPVANKAHSSTVSALNGMTAPEVCSILSSHVVVVGLFVGAAVGVVGVVVVGLVVGVVGLVVGIDVVGLFVGLFEGLVVGLVEGESLMQPLTIQYVVWP